MHFEKSAELPLGRLRAPRKTWAGVWERSEARKHCEQYFERRPMLNRPRLLLDPWQALQTSATCQFSYLARGREPAIPARQMHSRHRSLRRCRCPLLRFRPRSAEALWKKSQELVGWTF